MNKKAEIDNKVPLFGAIFVIVFLVCIVGAFMGFDQVDANHRGVMVRFGQVQGTMDVAEIQKQQGMFGMTKAEKVAKGLAKKDETN